MRRMARKGDGLRGRRAWWREVAQTGRGTRGGAIRDLRTIRGFALQSAVTRGLASLGEVHGRVRPHCWGAERLGKIHEPVGAKLRGD